MPGSLAVAPLQSRALVAVSGEDWRAFLQGLLTQDVETLATGEIRFGALLTPQGRLLFDLFLIGREDGAWLDVARDRRDDLIQRLNIYKLRAKVVVASDETVVSAAFSPASALSTSPPGEGALRDPRLQALGWRIYGDAKATTTEEAYEIHRLACGVPAPADWGSDETYPIEANFDLLGGIDFSKGCFVGQETTSRMKRRGQIKTRMVPLAFDGPAPPVGTEVLAGELRAGKMLSGGYRRAMALLRLDRIEGAALTVDTRPVRVDMPDWLRAGIG